MLRECVETLAAAPGFASGNWIVDATFGAGGHTGALLEADARVLALDRDPSTRVHAEPLAARFGAERFRFCAETTWAEMGAAASDVPVAGVLIDAGVSSMQLDSARGFSFRTHLDGPLSMRMDSAEASEERLTAETIVNEWSEAALARLLRVLGEERLSRRVAAAICDARRHAPISSSRQLADLVAEAFPARERRQQAAKRRHPATKTFMALRLYVNQELDQMDRGLAAAADLLVPDGRLTVLTYHSLEDRIVKRFIRSDERMCIPKGISRRARRPAEDELAENARASSARLRVAVRT